MTGNYATDLVLLVVLVWITLCTLLGNDVGERWARERRERQLPPGYDETDEGEEEHANE